MRARTHNFAGPAILVLLAGVLRFYGLGWGLPQVYEEAQPFRLAWSMWGWGDASAFDPNPHFFNYPSLYIYVQFAGQGLAFLGMKVTGMIHSVLDYRVRYALDPTPFYMMGRAITALFGIATVYVTYRLGRRALGQALGVGAALLVAVNTFHVSKSQVIEVDVPLTFFAILTLFLAVRLLETPTRRNYLLTGVAMGLAISTKYTAALLLLPLVTAHLVARRDSGEKPPWAHVGLAVAVGLAAFAVTSPFVLLDAKTFAQHMRLEGQHMRLGHFGSDTYSSASFYVRALPNMILGWPLSLLGLFGLVFLAGIRRYPWAIVLAAFLLPYTAVVASWSMKAYRYLLPAVPIVMLLAMGSLVEGFRHRRLAGAPSAARVGALVLAGLLLAAPSLARFPLHLERIQPDTRTVAKRWIEANIPRGSLILQEHYGPELFGPLASQRLDEDVRREVFERDVMPFYAVQMLPLMQVKPNRSAVFYDLSLYEDVDVVITSGIVRGRYVHEAERFQSQVAFYADLERHFEKALELATTRNSEPAITIYINKRHAAPFGDRGVVAGPRAVAAPPDGERKISRAEEIFYDNLGLNYETFGYHDEALAAYELAFRYPITMPPVYASLVMGRVRCLLALGRPAEAVRVLEMGTAATPSAEDRERFLRAKRTILSGAARPDP